MFGLYQAKMETAGAGEEDSDEETRDNLMEVDPDQDRKYLALFLSLHSSFWTEKFPVRKIGFFV